MPLNTNMWVNIKRNYRYVRCFQLACVCVVAVCVYTFYTWYPKRTAYILQRTLALMPKQHCKVAFGQVPRELSSGHIPMPDDSSIGQGWHTASQSSFVFSAYLTDGQVRIIGATLAASVSMLHCQIWCKYISNGAVTMVTTIARAEPIPESHETRVTAAYFICDVLPHTALRPYAVSLVGGNPCEMPNHVLAVQAPPANVPPTKVPKFAVCVSPLSYNYNRTHYLVEWLELNRILGAGHFYIYNHNSTEHVQKVLDFYSDLGIVDSFPWAIPSSIHHLIDIHYHGQLAALNDCLYRSREKHDYIAVFDLDEFIIPRNITHQTWSEMLQDLPDASAYIFRNTFFRINSTDDLEHTGTSEDDEQLFTMSRLQRETAILGYNERSKYMVKPTRATTIGIHIVHVYKEGGYRLVDPDIGLLHHYRYWLHRPAELVRDDTMFKYRDTLKKKVMYIWDSIPGIFKTA